MKNQETNSEGKVFVSEPDSLKSRKSPGVFSRHKMSSALLIIIVLISIGAFAYIKFMEYRYKKALSELKTDYQNKTDSISARQLMLAAKTLSWAVRSELTRQNKEQVNQFFMNMIAEPAVTKVEFVDAITSRVTLSTNKKNEGTTYPDRVALMTTEPISYKNDSVLTVVAPVMNLNSKLGVLVIEYNLN